MPRLSGSLQGMPLCVQDVHCSMLCSFVVEMHLGVLVLGVVWPWLVLVGAVAAWAILAGRDCGKWADGSAAALKIVV